MRLEQHPFVERIAESERGSGIYQVAFDAQFAVVVAEILAVYNRQYPQEDGAVADLKRRMRRVAGGQSYDVSVEDVESGTVEVELATYERELIESAMNEVFGQFLTDIENCKTGWYDFE